MPILVKDGQPTLVPHDSVVDFLRKGYLYPKGSAPATGASQEFSPPPPDPATFEVGGASVVANVSTVPGIAPLDLATASLSMLRSLPEVGTAEAKQIQKLAKSKELSLPKLQETLKEVDWAGLIAANRILVPGGIEVSEPKLSAEQAPEQSPEQTLDANLKEGDIEEKKG